MKRVLCNVSWTRAVIGGAVWLGLAGGGATAQVAPPGTRDAEATIATDPIRCWWKTGKSAVYVGERLALTLTCSVVDTPGVRVIAEESKLDPTAIQLPPFDVVEGTRHPDIQAGQRRLFQYEYSLRVVGEDLFGRDVVIPALDIRYRVQSDVEAAATVESLEQMYRLPAMPVRVMALVSPQAVDIRDAPAETFKEIQNRRFRGNVAFALAALLFSAGLGSLVVAAGGMVRRYRTPSVRATRLISETGILRGALRELQEVQRRAQYEGWSRDAIGRALAAMRLGIAIALGQRPPQTVVGNGAPGLGGAVIVRSGRLRPRRLMVSASVTGEAFGPGPEDSHSGRARAVNDPMLLDDLRSTLAVFTAARYGRHEVASRDDLDRALEDALTLLVRLRAQRSWATVASGAIGRAIAMRRVRVQ